jgi:hypothetical protein
MKFNSDYFLFKLIISKKMKEEIYKTLFYDYLLRTTNINCDDNVQLSLVRSKIFIAF